MVMGASIFMMSGAVFCRAMRKRATGAQPQGWAPVTHSLQSALARRTTAAKGAEDDRDQEQHHGDEEDDLRDLHRSACDATEPEHTGDQRNHKKRQYPAKHGLFLTLTCGRTRLVKQSASQGRSSSAHSVQICDEMRERPEQKRLRQREGTLCKSCITR